MGAFWDAWNKQGQVNDQAAAAQIQQIGGLAGLMKQVQEQQQMQKVQGLLSDPSIPLEQKRVSLLGMMRDPAQAVSAIHTMQLDEKPIPVPAATSLVDPKTRQEVFRSPDRAPNHAGTMNERAYQTLSMLQRKHQMGQPLSEDEHMQAQMARSLLSQERAVVDPTTGQTTLFKPISLPNSWTVGLDSYKPAGSAPLPGATPTGRGGSLAAILPILCYINNDRSPCHCKGTSCSIV